jgi:hypothetical protein
VIPRAVGTPSLSREARQLALKLRRGACLLTGLSTAELEAAADLIVRGWATWEEDGDGVLRLELSEYGRAIAPGASRPS